VVEQGTHKPLVGSSNLPPGSFSCMAWVYILRGSTGRHYIGSTVDLDARFAQHLRGHTATTKRLGGNVQIVAQKEVGTLLEARKLERVLKEKKNPQLAIFHLSQ
jgi:predicted GIY-YIG superfamily endonuclease